MSVVNTHVSPTPALHFGQGTSSTPISLPPSVMVRLLSNAITTSDVSQSRLCIGVRNDDYGSFKEHDKLVMKTDQNPTEEEKQW